MNNPFIRGILLIIGIFICFGLFTSIIENFQRTDMVGQRETVLRAEEQKNKALMNQLKEATSASFIEEQARDKLGLVKPGDTVVFIGNGQQETSVQQAPGENLTRWQKWWELFF